MAVPRHGGAKLLVNSRFVSWRRLLGGAYGPALLKAFAAENRAALGGAKGNGGVFTALRAGGLSFGADLRVAASSPGADAVGTLGFAGLAALRLVLEAFVRKKHLFAGREISEER